MNWRPGEFMVPGGGFPLPPAAAELASQLPPPTCFKGPYVIIDKLCDIFDKIRLPDTFQPASGADQHSVQLFDIARSVQWSVGEDGRKRKSLGRSSAQMRQKLCGRVFKMIGIFKPSFYGSSLIGLKGH